MNWLSVWLQRGGHLWVGLAWILICEAGLFAGVWFFGVFFTPLVWWGYIVLVDGAVRRLRGRSPLVDCFPEFRNMAALSIPLWLIFDYYNFFLDNWHYEGLPEDPKLRFLGYAVAFASILPALVLTADLLSHWLPAAPAPRRRPVDGRARLLVTLGLLMLVGPLLFPSRYVFASVWIGFILLCDPLNASRGLPSFLSDWESGSLGRALPLFLGGYVCGLLWEFWNYWSIAKWHYTVPFFPEVRIFEMPVVGFLGFGPFALEMYAMYLWVRGGAAYDLAASLGDEG